MCLREKGCQHFLIYLSTFPSSRSWPNFTFHLFNEPVFPNSPHQNILHRFLASPQVSTIKPSFTSSHLTSLTSHLTLSTHTNFQAYLISLPTRSIPLISSHPFISNSLTIFFPPLYLLVIILSPSSSSPHLLYTSFSPYLLPIFSLPPPHSKKAPSPRLWEGFRLLIKLPIPAGERKAEAGMRCRGRG